MDLNTAPVYAQGYLVKGEPASLAIALHPSLGVQEWELAVTLEIGTQSYLAQVTGPNAVWNLSATDVEDILLVGNTSHRVRFNILNGDVSIVAGRMSVLEKGTGLETPGLSGVTVVAGPPGAPGVDGVDGTDGIDGTDGVDGIDGTNGTDGTVLTPDPTYAMLYRMGV